VACSLVTEHSMRSGYSKQRLILATRNLKLRHCMKVLNTKRAYDCVVGSSVHDLKIEKTADQRPVFSTGV